MEPEHKVRLEGADLTGVFAQDSLPGLEMNTNDRAILAHHLSEWSARGRPAQDQKIA